MPMLESYIKFVPTLQIERDLLAAVRSATSEENISYRERVSFLEEAKVLIAELEQRYQR